MMGNYFGGGYGYMGGFGFFFMLLFWGLVIWALITLVKAISEKRQSPSEIKEDEAMKVLRERYAKGEITKEQFEQTKKDLNG
ncbi:MAG: SHOCT domain-containing protein [Candidatus Moranbacteria bacterium]|nr:SHOCT domain-containing protein [Candidatus Moranbacteria bacterium]